MHETLLNKYGVKQLGFYVKDLEQAARAFADLFGAGPFFDLGVAEPRLLEYRGAPSDLRVRCALGQLGDMQIELVEVLTEGPDVYRELGRYGLHHVCIWTDEAEQAAEDLARAGCEVAMRMESGAGLSVYYLDCRETLGVYLEVNAPIEELRAAVKRQADGWDGARPLRDVSELAR